MKLFIRIILLFTVLLITSLPIKGQVSGFTREDHGVADLLKASQRNGGFPTKRHLRSTHVEGYKHSRTGRCFGFDGDNDTRQKPDDGSDPYDIDPRINKYKSFFYSLFRFGTKPSQPENTMPNGQPYPYEFFVQK